jgi:hypothetical protein
LIGFQKNYPQPGRFWLSDFSASSFVHKVYRKILRQTLDGFFDWEYSGVPGVKKLLRH